MARLPIPGQDDNTWGDILNAFLEVAHNSDGSLQNSAISAAGGVTTVNSKIPDNSGNVTIGISELSDTNITSLTNNQVLMYNSGQWVNQINPSAPDASSSTPGLVQLTNDLGGTYSSPTIVSTHLSAALPINQGGTGSNTQNFVDLSSAQSNIQGAKTFTTSIDTPLLNVDDGSTKEYSLRTDGSLLDFEGAGSDIVMSVYSGYGRTGTQYSYIRMESGGQHLHLVGPTWVDTSPYGSGAITFDATQGIFPGSTGTLSVGASSNYWQDGYISRVYLNSTAYLDGGTAGQVTIAGELISTTSSGNTSLANTTSGSGLILSGKDGVSTSALRIVSNGGAWTDSVETAYFQIFNSNNPYAVFMSGTYGNDAQFARLQFASEHTSFYTEGYSETPVPTATVEMVNGRDQLLLKIKGYSSQTNDLQEWQSSNGSALLAIDSSGNIKPSDGVNLILGTTTGTQVGTSSNQKLGFYGTTPVVQPSGDVATALGNLGLISSPTIAATSYSGILPIANGGTGSGTQNFVDLSTAQTKTATLIIKDSTGIELLDPSGTGKYVNIHTDASWSRLGVGGGSSGFVFGCLTMFEGSSVQVKTSIFPESGYTTANVGSTSQYMQYAYFNRYYLNSTAYLDGGTAGTVAVTGVVTTTGGITPRVNTLAVSSNTYTPNIGTTDLAIISSPTANFTVAAPSGTPSDGQRFILRIVSGSTVYTPSWASGYISSGSTALPTSLNANKTQELGFTYNLARTSWVLVAFDSVGY